MEKLVLIDGHSILNRAFYGVPNLTNSEGLHTNAVYGFLNILFKVLDEEKADYLAVAFDLKAPTFRHKMFDAYKGTRKPMPEELHEQVPLMKEVLTAMGVPILTKGDDPLRRPGSFTAFRHPYPDLSSEDKPWNHRSTQLLPGGRDPGVPGNTGAVYRGEGPDGRRHPRQRGD